MREPPTRPKPCSDSEPPIASRVDPEAVQQLMRKDVMPTRNTINRIRSNEASPSGGSSSEGLAGVMLRFLLSGAAEGGGMGGVLGRLRGQGKPASPNATQPQCQLPPPAHLALMDGSAEDAPVAGGGAPTPPAVL